MRVRRSLASLAVAVLVVAAGCAGLPVTETAATDQPAGTMGTPATPGDGPRSPTPTATAAVTPTAEPEPTPSGTPTAVVDERVPVEGASLPVDASRVFARVEALVGIDAEPPTVEVSDEAGEPPDGVPPSELFAAFGASEAPGEIGSCGAIARGSAGGDTVRVGIGGLSAEQVELLLVHEFVHVLQDQFDRLSVDDGAELGPYVEVALTEGAAVFVANRYAEVYDRSWGNRSMLSLRRCFFRRAGDGTRLTAAWYYFGGRHFARRLDAADNLSRVYEAPPATGEQLLDGLSAGTDPPVELDTDIRVGSDWELEGRYPGGELRLRTLLAGSLAASRAAAAADGWGNDQVLAFGEGYREGFAWVVRFDTSGDAAEFVAAFEAYEEAVESRDGVEVRLEQVDAATVVLFGGPAAFVAGASATGDNGTVTVAPPGA